MIRFRSFVNCALLAACLGASAFAQDQAAPSTHEAAARELYAVAGGARMAEVGFEAMMPMVRGNPELAPYEDVFREWYRKVFAGDELENGIAKLYMESFSEQELRGLIDFYKSPLGAKALEQMPRLAQQGVQLGQRLAEKRTDELKSMLEKAKQEREGAKQ
jgi:uncharacterized protein